MGRLTVLLVRVSHHCSSQGTWPMGSYIILGPVLLGHSLSDRGREIWVLPGENKAGYPYPRDKEPTQASLAGPGPRVCLTVRSCALSPPGV